MTNHLIYSLVFTLFLGFPYKGLANTTIEKNFCNSTFTISNFENKIQQDTTPNRSRSKETYRTNIDGEKVYLSIVDGEIKKLKINGRKIPKDDYGQYETLIDDLRNDAPTPPSNDIATPTPPTPPSPPSSKMDEIEEAHQKIEEAHLQIEEAHREIEAIHKDLEHQNESTSETIVQELIKDGLISNEKRYKIYLTSKKLKVNGKTQDKAIHKKYLSLYEKLNGKKMGAKSTYRISKNDF